MQRSARLLGALLAVAMLFGMVIVSPALADRGSSSWKIDDIRRETQRPSRSTSSDRDRDYRRKGYELDRRYRHDHYYPRKGLRYRSLPAARRSVHYRGTDYFFYSGSWYVWSSGVYVVTAPPPGLSVTFLPPYYTTVWVGGVPYYYAAGTYYNWVPERNVYVVANPPPENAVVEEPEVPERLFAYPREGQSDQQLASDRYECHTWARSQTGFDPTQPGGGVAAAQNAALRADYNRAMKACLEGRGYSVQ